ncbi:MAG: LysR family transcriptional regulator [Myxococcales bacterium]|nr:MAG: LysR family transcriptional regulator [Myxococcales bacterium]
MDGIDLDGITTFVRVVEKGGISPAARFLAVPKSTVSRRLSRLEEELGVQLLRRSSRQIRLTQAGETFFGQVVSAIDRLIDATEIVRDVGAEPIGEIRITAPEDFSHMLAAIIHRFCNIHPGIRIYVELSNRIVDLVREGFDLAIRAGELHDSALVARKVMSTELWLVAAPAYLKEHGKPRNIASLSKHPAVLFRAKDNQQQWTLNKSGQSQSVEVQGTINTTAYSISAALVEAGSGIALIPSFLAAKSINAGALERVLPSWLAKAGAVHVVQPASRYLPERVRLFKDYLIKHIEPCAQKGMFA